MKIKINVLLVEDDQADRHLIRGILESDDSVHFNTEDSSSLSKACKKLKENHYNVIILDLNLPDCTGLDTLNQIRNITPKIPVVVLTGISNENTGIRAIKKGADDYLVKNNLLRHTLVRTLRYAIERKNCQNNLCKSQNLMKLSLDSMNSNIVILDYRGIITKVNKSWCDFADENGLISDNYEIGKKYIDFCRCDENDEYAERALKGVEKLLSGKNEKFSMEYPCHSPSEKRWFEMDASAFEFESRRWVIIVHNNITERKLARQRQDKLFDELQKSNNELKDFAKIVSHDLKAPLRGIKMLAEWIQEDYADRLDEEGRENIQLMTERTYRMHQLIDGILEYSRIGRIREKQVAVDIEDLIAQIIQSIAPPDNIEMKITDKLPLVTAEPTRMLQLFQNLITNAVKYIDKPRGVIEIGCTFESDFCKFCVRDNGIGIDKKHSERIFQIFQKLVPDDDPQSTGIGLTIAKKIVELYGGKIWFESPPDSGTSFYFTFPLGIVSEKQTEKGSKKIPQSVFRKEL